MSILLKNQRTKVNAMSKKVLALYDFASKQSFIYRTSKIKEISGASQLLSEMFKRFPDILKDQLDFKYNTASEFKLEDFNSDAEVLYDGGGSLMVLYKDEDTYKKANRIISKHILINYPSLSMIACCVECKGDFNKDKTALYSQNRIRKNRYPASDITAVIPFVQVDPMTFMPVVHKEINVNEELSLSADRVVKRNAYKVNANDNLEGLEGLSAVIYIDGNAMGKKLMKLSSEDYNTGVNNLRSFSKEVNRIYVEEPLKAFDEYLKNSNSKGYRKVIGGGDEITIVCDAEIAYELVKIYFDKLEENNVNISNEDDKHYSCAGISVFHSKSPFNVAYDIAEAACESAKKRAHCVQGNYFDFYYCHAGITSDFDTLRDREQFITKRPYKFDFAKKEFERIGEILRKAGRSNVKVLGTATQIGKEQYCFQAERINAYLKENALKTENDNFEDEMKIVYDMAEFYDLWFAKKEDD